MYCQFGFNVSAIHSCSSNEIKKKIFHTIKTAVCFVCFGSIVLACTRFSYLAKSIYVKKKAMLKPAKCQVYKLFASLSESYL